MAWEPCVTIPERPNCRSWLVVTSLIVVIATMVVVLAIGTAEGTRVKPNANAAVLVGSFRTDNCLTVNGKGLNCEGLGTVHPAQIEEHYLLAFRQSSC
jgi:hypothetical protein